MAIEAVAASAGGMGGVGSIPNAGAQDGAVGKPSAGDAGIRQAAAEPNPAPRDVALESRAGRVGGPAEGPLNRTPEVSAAPHRSGASIGRSAMERMNELQKGDTAWRAGEGGKAQPANEPTLKVAQREPGPAASQLKPDASHGPEVAGQPTIQPGKSRNPSFDGMIHQLEQVSGQVVQVSIVSKTTSSFTGSLNKLLSSG